MTQAAVRAGQNAVQGFGQQAAGALRRAFGDGGQVAADQQVTVFREQLLQGPIFLSESQLFALMGKGADPGDLDWRHSGIKVLNVYGQPERWVKAEEARHLLAARDFDVLQSELGWLTLGDTAEALVPMLGTPGFNAWHGRNILKFPWMEHGDGYRLVVPPRTLELGSPPVPAAPAALAAEGEALFGARPAALADAPPAAQASAVQASAQPAAGPGWSVPARRVPPAPIGDAGGAPATAVEPAASFQTNPHGAGDYFPRGDQ